MGTTLEDTIKEAEALVSQIRYWIQCSGESEEKLAALIKADDLVGELRKLGDL